MMWAARAYHAPIRSNYGWLRFVLVTPQSHRVHHSILPKHHHSNYGTVLCVWDRVFGTAWPEVDVYPPTGLDEPIVPGEETPTRVATGRAFLSQFWYPFGRLFGWLRERRPRTPRIQG
jgi:sterol desaturase/sphingolipid hydroxylase (fatty acid hydroxylase superfamily)